MVSLYIGILTALLFVCILLLLVSYFVFYDENKLYIRTKILRGDCVRYRVNNRLDRFQCSVIVEYTIDTLYGNQTYQKSIKYTGHVNLNKGDDVTLVVNKLNPHEVYITRFDRDGTYALLSSMFSSIYIVSLLYLFSMYK